MEFGIRKIFLLLCILGYFESAYCFDKVVVWGYRIHTHTHNHIHERLVRAFQYLGYPTYWFCDEDAIGHIDFSNTLFFVTGGQDNGIPIRKDCHYILHHCDSDKYQKNLDQSQYIIFEFYADSIRNNPNLTKIDDCIYYNVSLREVYMPFASDMLPIEIEEVKKSLPFRMRTNEVPWIGTIGHEGAGRNAEQLGPFKRACAENGLDFIHFDPWQGGISRQDANALYYRAYFAPTIINHAQLSYGYVPCRLFITISCGQMGITNSLPGYELFKKKIVYNPDTYQLFYDAKKRMETWTLEDQYEIMDIVKEKHTYLNRIQTFLDFFNLVNKDIGPAVKFEPKS